MNHSSAPYKKLKQRRCRANDIVTRIRNVECAIAVQCETTRKIEARACGRTAVARISPTQTDRPSHRADHTPRTHSPYNIISTVRYVKTAADGETHRKRKARIGRGTTVTGITAAKGVVPGDCGNDTRSINLANYVIQRITDVNIADRIQPNVRGIVQTRVGSSTSVTRIGSAQTIFPSNRGNNPICINLAN